MKLNTLIQDVKRLSRENPCFIIGIDGRSGAGKSVLAKKLSMKLPDVQIIEADFFYYEPHEITSETIQEDFNYNWRRIESELLKALYYGKSTQYKRNFWDASPQEHDGKMHTIEPEGFIIIEGCFLFRKELRQYFDYTIWVEANKKVCVKRIVSREIKRQTSKSKNDLETEWVKIVQPMEDKYIQALSPQTYADFVMVT